MKVLVAIAGALLLSTGLLVFKQPAEAQQGKEKAPAAACPNPVFCGGWLSTCKRTGGVDAVCQQRYKACLSSGSFHFNNPRPRCKNNPADYALSYSCHRRAG